MRLSYAFICAVGVLACGPGVCAQNFVLDYQSVQGKTGVLSTSQFFVEGGMVSLQGTGNGTTMQTNIPVTVAMCGDDIREGNEACDGNDLGSVSCQSLGFSGGNILCTEQCAIDSSGCTSEESIEEDLSQNTGGGTQDTQPESSNTNTGGHRGTAAQATTIVTVSESQTQPSFHVEEQIELATETDFLLPPQNTTLKQESKPLPMQHALTNIREESSGIPIDQTSSLSATSLAEQISNDTEVETQKPSGSFLASLLVQFTANTSALFTVVVISVAGLLVQLFWIQYRSVHTIPVRSGISSRSRNRRTHRSSVRISSNHQKNKSFRVHRSRIRI